MSDTDPEVGRNRAIHLRAWQSRVAQAAKRHRSNLNLCAKIVLILTSSIFTWIVIVNTGALLKDRDLLQSTIEEGWRLRYYDLVMQEAVVKAYLLKMQGRYDVDWQVSHERAAFHTNTSLANLARILATLPASCPSTESASVAGRVDGGCQSSAATLVDFSTVFNSRYEVERQLLALPSISVQSSTLLASSALHQSQFTRLAEMAASMSTEVETSRLGEAISSVAQLRTIAIATVVLCILLEVDNTIHHTRALLKARVRWYLVAAILLVSAAASVDESVSRFKIIDELAHQLGYIHDDALPVVGDSMSWMYFDAQRSASVASFALGTLLGDGKAATDSQTSYQSAINGSSSIPEKYLARKTVGQLPELSLYSPTITTWDVQLQEMDTAVFANASTVYDVVFAKSYLVGEAMRAAATSSGTMILHTNLAATIESAGALTSQLLHLSVVLTVFSISMLVALERVVWGTLLEARQARMLVKASREILNVEQKTEVQERVNKSAVVEEAMQAAAGTITVDY